MLFREGSKFVDVWSDGSEIRNVKEQLVEKKLLIEININFLGKYN